MAPVEGEIIPQSIKIGGPGFLNSRMLNIVKVPKDCKIDRQYYITVKNIYSPGI